MDAVHNPRSVLHARLSGRLVALLFSIRSTRFPCLDLDDALEELALYLRADLDCVLDFAIAGGASALTGALATALRVGKGEGQATADLCGSVLSAYAASVPAGWVVPSCAQPMAAPLTFDFSAFLSCTPSDNELIFECTLARASVGAADAGQVALPPIVLRRVSPEQRRQAAQEDVGFSLWPAALPFSRWVVAHRAALFSRPPPAAARVRVLELGAGCGLCGIVAGLATLPAPVSVTLSDFNPTVLANLHINACLNAPHLHRAKGEEEACGPWKGAQLGALAARDGEEARLFSIVQLDWSADGCNSRDAEDGGGGGGGGGGGTGASEGGQVGAAESAEACASRGSAAAAASPLKPLSNPPTPCTLGQDERFDVILGSDIIVQEEDARLVAKVIGRRLAASGGVAIVCMPPARVRWGVAAFPPALTANGLSFKITHFQPELLDAKLADETCVASGYEPLCDLFIIRRAE